MAKHTCNPEDVYKLFMEGRSVRWMTKFLRGHPTEINVTEALRSALLAREQQKVAAIKKLLGKRPRWPSFWPKSEAEDEDS